MCVAVFDDPPDVDTFFLLRERRVTVNPNSCTRPYAPATPVGPTSAVMCPRLERTDTDILRESKCDPDGWPCAENVDLICLRACATNTLAADRILRFISFRSLDRAARFRRSYAAPPTNRTFNEIPAPADPPTRAPALTKAEIMRNAMVNATRCGMVQSRDAMQGPCSWR